MIDVFFFCFIIIFILVNYFVVRKLSLQSILTSPFILFGVFFCIMHLLLPFFQWKVSFFRYETGYDEDHYIYSLFYLMLAYIIVYLSYTYFSKSRRRIIANDQPQNKIIDTGSINYKKVFAVGVIIYCIGGYFAYQNFSLISLLGQEEYLSDRISLGKGRGLQVNLAHWMYISSILFFFLVLTGKDLSKRFKRIIFIMFLVSVVTVIIYYGINSNRNSIFILIVNLTVLYFAFKKEKKKRRSSVGSVAKMGIFLIIILGLFFQLGKNRKQGALKDSSAEYSIIEALNGAFGNHENIVWLLEHSNKTKLHYGVTYSAGITNFVPRSIWPDKPLGAGPILKNTIYPGSYVVGRRGNSSLTTGLFNELQMNFGILGMLLGSILYGVMLSKMSVFLIQSTNPITLIIVQYTLIVFSTVFMYGEFLGFLSRFIITLSPLILIKFLIKK